jgi:hypothetical protein
MTKDLNDVQFEQYVIDLLGTNEVTVDFVKKDGSERNMRCTLNIELIPEDKRPTVKTIVEAPETRPEAVRVFDLDKQDWRSFRWDSLKGLMVGDKSIFTVEGF